MEQFRLGQALKPGDRHAKPREPFESAHAAQNDAAGQEVVRLRRPPRSDRESLAKRSASRSSSAHAVQPEGARLAQVVAFGHAPFEPSSGLRQDRSALLKIRDPTARRPDDPSRVSAGGRQDSRARPSRRRSDAGGDRGLNAALEAATLFAERLWPDALQSRPPPKRGGSARPLQGYSLFMMSLGA